MSVRNNNDSSKSSIRTIKAELDIPNEIYPLSSPLQIEIEREVSEPYILFEIADTIYGLRSQVVQHIEMIKQITPVPNTASFVEGVIYSRGQVIPVVNLRVRFGFEKISYNVRSRLIVVHTDTRTVGMIADSAREFVLIPLNVIQPPAEAISGLSGKYLEGIATWSDRLILILNVDELLNSTDLIRLEQESLIGKDS